MQSSIFHPLSPLSTPIACNLIPTALFKLFPRQLIKPDKGPLWELNRRTGLVTVYHYDKKGTWGRTGQPEEETAPFYEFDAYTSNELIHGGGVVHTLYLAHRYRNILIPIGTLIGKTNPEECYALWDMFQNFMDTSAGHSPLGRASPQRPGDCRTRPANQSPAPLLAGYG